MVKTWTNWERDTKRITLRDRYNNYVKQCDNGRGIDITTGKRILSYDEWLNS